MTSLRIPSSHASFSNLVVPSGEVLPLTGVSGTQIEIIAVLNISAASTGCGFRVLSTGTGTGAGQEYTSVGIESYTQTYMPGIDLPGV